MLSHEWKCFYIDVQGPCLILLISSNVVFHQLQCTGSLDINEVFILRCTRVLILFISSYVVWRIEVFLHQLQCTGSLISMEVFLHRCTYSWYYLSPAMLSGAWKCNWTEVLWALILFTFSSHFIWSFNTELALVCKS